MANAVRIISTEDPKLQWIDRAKTIMDVATRAGTAYLGYQAFEKVTPGSGLAGVIVSQVALRLANANNIVSGGAGVATLASMGIINVWPSGPITFDPIATGQTWMDDLGSYFRSIGILPPLAEEYT